MMHWVLPGDRTLPVITAERHLASRHRGREIPSLPHTCVVFEIGMAIKHIEKEFETSVLAEKLPCFLDSPACVAVRRHPGVCFTRGGYGAPAAVDTLETLRALGVGRIVVAGMCGAFSPDVRVGDVIIPERVLCEEGTSRHYFEELEFARPDPDLFRKAASYFGNHFRIRTDPTVTSDAVYRQTFAKEEYWRSRGCAGVDMESSALLAVSRYYSVPAVAVLLVSDRHPLCEGEGEWEWGDPDFGELRRDFVKDAALFALGL